MGGLCLLLLAGSAWPHAFAVDVTSSGCPPLGCCSCRQGSWTPAGTCGELGSGCRAWRAQCQVHQPECGALRAAGARGRRGTWAAVRQGAAQVGSHRGRGERRQEGALQQLRARSPSPGVASVCIVRAPRCATASAPGSTGSSACTWHVILRVSIGISVPSGVVQMVVGRYRRHIQPARSRFDVMFCVAMLLVVCW